jgi:hypothetical protein
METIKKAFSTSAITATRCQRTKEGSESGALIIGRGVGDFDALGVDAGEFEGGGVNPEGLRIKS